MDTDTLIVQKIAEQEKQKLESKMAEVEQFCQGLSKESNQHTIWRKQADRSKS